MAQASQKRAVANHRRRLAERGISRYEVRGLEKDKELVRKLAKHPPRTMRTRHDYGQRC